MKRSREPARPSQRRVTHAQARQAAANLTVIDSLLLHLLFRLRYLRTTQVRRLVYPDRAPMYVWQRLNVLHHRGLIDNVKIRDGSSTVALWHLDRLGLILAEDLDGIPEEARTPLRDYTVSSMYARHYSETAEIYIALCNGVHVDYWRWSNQRERYQYGEEFEPYRNGSRLRPQYLQPDATVHMATGYDTETGWVPEGWNTFYLELDRSTMSLGVMSEKFGKYRRWFAKLAGGDWRPTNLGHYLLVVCPSKQRAANLQELLNERNLPACAVTPEQALPMLIHELEAWWLERLASR